ncbi:serine/threonine protein kinase, partial [Nanoarchaeota archaeon]
MVEGDNLNGSSEEEPEQGSKSLENTLDDTWRESSASGRIGNYKILKELGRGGMGIVYLAEHKMLGNKVALKVMLGGKSLTGEGIARFYEEARSTAQLSSKLNIARAYDMGEIRDNLYFVMDFIKGSSLDHLIKGGEVTCQRAVDIIEKTADTLNSVHEAGLIHRDLKPGNIIVSEQGEPYIVDFGIVKFLDPEKTSHTRADVRLGTIAYMSPEQAEDPRSVDERSDIYSLGVVLYKTLTNTIPFDFKDKSLFARLKTVVEEDPTPPREHNPDIPESLEQITMKCMAKKPDDRYQTASALADDLKAYREGIYDQSELIVIVDDEPAPQREEFFLTEDGFGFRDVVLYAPDGKPFVEYDEVVIPFESVRKDAGGVFIEAARKYILESHLVLRNKEHLTSEDKEDLAKSFDSTWNSGDSDYVSLYAPIWESGFANLDEVWLSFPLFYHALEWAWKNQDRPEAVRIRESFNEYFIFGTKCVIDNEEPTPRIIHKIKGYGQEVELPTTDSWDESFLRVLTGKRDISHFTEIIDGNFDPYLSHCVDSMGGEASLFSLTSKDSLTGKEGNIKIAFEPMYDFDEYSNGSVRLVRVKLKGGESNIPKTLESITVSTTEPEKKVKSQTKSDFFLTEDGFGFRDVVLYAPD